MRPPAPDADATHFDVYQNYEIEAERRDDLREFLAAHGIGTLLPWGGKAVHQWEALGCGRACPRPRSCSSACCCCPCIRGFAMRMCNGGRGGARVLPGAGVKSTGWLIKHWQTMTLIRRAEERIAGMVESGEVGCPCHLYIGQEAIAAGVCAALSPRTRCGEGTARTATIWRKADRSRAVR